MTINQTIRNIWKGAGRLGVAGLATLIVGCATENKTYTLRDGTKVNRWGYTDPFNNAGSLRLKIVWEK